jgi:putative ABC transport system permease protein
MKVLALIAWRNLWRNKRRSLVVITSIALGILSMVLSAALMNGMNNQMVENTISTSLGHVAVHRKGFFEFMKLRYSFTPEREIVEAIERTPHVASYAPRIKVQGMIQSSETSRGVMMVGIDPAREKKVSRVFDYMLGEGGGAFLDSPDDGSVLISKSLAERLDLLVGDRLVLMIQDRNQEIVGVGMTVKGLYRTPMESFDLFVAFTGIKKLQEISGLRDEISEINILLDSKAAVDGVKGDLVEKTKNRGLEVLSWKDMAPNLVSAIRLFDTMMYIFFSIVFITVVFSVANTLIMAIMERFHEIGVMKSIGTRPYWIFTMVMFEAVNLGLVGLLIGTGAGVIVTWILSITGIDFSFYMESMRSWGTGSVIYPAVKFMDIVAASVIVLGTTVIAALYPAVKAARIRPLEALHYI